MSQTQRPNMSEPPSHPPSCSSIWTLSYMKLQFFTCIRLFLQSKKARKSKPRGNNNKVMVAQEEVAAAAVDRENDDQEGDSVVLQRSVKQLLFGRSWEEKERAAMEIERLAREDVKTRKLMAELCVIPALVAMVVSEVASRRRVAVKALIELANGSYTNKAVMVEAGILTKLPKKIDVIEEAEKHEFAELILSLSSFANSQPHLASSELLPFLVGILQSGSSSETKESCLGTLYNLSAVLENARPLVSNGVVPTLLRLILVKELTEKALATLGHLAVTVMGKKAMENSSVVPESLIEILAWEDRPKCQELSAYILMILAHQSSTQREKMSKSGIVPVLLEVALLGSPLAQKRALKLLQWFKDERQAKMGPHSGPQTGRIAMGSPLNQREAQQGKQMMKSLVKQSLYKNMEMITRRANAAGDDSSKLKSLVISTSSKSLPY